MLQSGHQHTKDVTELEQYQVWMADPMMSRGAAGQTLLLLAVEGTSRDSLSTLPPEGMLCRVVGTMMPAVPAPSPLPAPENNPDERRITRLLSAIGIPSNLLGYAYLRSALMLVAARPELGKHLTTQLYPDIAAQYRVAPRSVERAIRHAICLAWERGSGEGYRRALGRLGSIVGDRPTNSEFLAQTAECIRIGAFA
jgi:two-component system response regulator (stage 0 sporulation protein A)